MVASRTAGRSGCAYAAVLVLLAVGAAIVLVSYGMTWAVARVPLVSEDAGAVHDLALTGRDLLPWAAVSGWVALAGLAGIAATRSWGRQAVGVVVLLAGLASVAGALWFAAGSGSLVSVSLRSTVDPGVSVAFEASPAWLLAVLGGLAVLVCGVATVLRGRSWPVMGAKYERAAGGSSTRSAWDLQDMGQDPTDDLVE